VPAAVAPDVIPKLAAVLALRFMPSVMEEPRESSVGAEEHGAATELPPMLPPHT
jgi:hypothetical protein